MLEIKNLHVNVDGKEILKGVNLILEKGKVHALMGPNGSGKSTLANVLMGNPKYEVVKGEILFNGENILDLSTEEKAKRGIFLSFQYPQEVEGVTIRNFLRTAINSLRENKISIIEFQRLLREKSELLNLPDGFSERYLNSGFSGGEKKKSEMLQMLTLNPSLAVLDETDSGLDIDALKAVAKGVNSFKSEDKIILIITHYKRILELIPVDKLSILIDGKIALEGSNELVDQLEEKGYGWIEKD